MKSLVVGISGINATDNPGPGVAVARSLQEGSPEATCIGLSYDVHDPGNYMPELFRNSFLMPYPTEGWNRMQTALTDVRAKTGLSFILPCLDAELPLMIRHNAQLDNMGIASFLPNEEQFELRSKDKLVDLSKRLECQYPDTVAVYSIDELVKALKDEIELPAVVKGKYYKAYLVYNIDNAVLKGAEIAAEWGFPLLVQRRVTGQEINLIGLADGEGHMLGSVAIKKQLTTHLGKIWTGVTIADERLSNLAATFCRTTGWRGPFELECIRTSDGICLIEINPRFPAWVYFATAVGVNLPKMLLDYAVHGQRGPVPEYPVGKYLVRQTSEFVTDLTPFQNLLMTRNREGL